MLSLIKSRRNVKQKRGVFKGEQKEEGQVEWLWLSVLRPKDLTEIDFYFLKWGRKFPEPTSTLTSMHSFLRPSTQEDSRTLPGGDGGGRRYCSPGQTPGTHRGGPLAGPSPRGPNHHCCPTDVSWVSCWTLGGHERYSMSKIIVPAFKKFRDYWEDRQTENKQLRYYRAHRRKVQNGTGAQS